jgi:5-hydroxyisourate hydrolase-like protein (transthyretin family)
MLGKGKSLLKKSLRWQVVAGLVCLLLVPLIIVVTGCGGGGEGPKRQPTLSGTVTAPQGTPVAAAPSFWQRLSAWFISVAEAQALQGQAVPEAKVKAYIWSLNLDLSKPVSTTNTKSDGRYTLLLPPEAAGKDIVVIVEKQVQGGTIRLSRLVADVPSEGMTGVNIDAAKSIVQMLRDFGVSAKDLPETEANTINAALTEQQTVISSEIKIAQEFLDRINFPKRVLGFSNLSENPSVFSTTASGQATTEVEGYVYNDLEGRPIPNATVDAYIGSQKIATTKTDSSGRFAMQLRIAQTSVVTFVATSGNFVGAETRRINPGEEAWVYIDIPQSDLIGLPPGKYREIWTSDQWLPRILERIGDAPDNKTWIVEVAQAGNVSGTIRSRQESERAWF